MDARSTFREVLGLELGLIRVSAYWDEIRTSGYGELDWLIDAARAAGRSILLTVGMKALHWPEFYLPHDVRPVPDRRGRIGVEQPLADQVVAFVTETVSRYRDHPEISAWQVENEPFNRSGPQGWWIDPRLVRREIEAVRRLDVRPIVLNAFAHFNAGLDSGSRPRRGPFGRWQLVPERVILKLTGPSGVLGLDVYSAIAVVEVNGAKLIRRAEPGWADTAERWLRMAERTGGSAWIIECQSEPWEPLRETLAEPQSFSPADMRIVYDGLVGAGFSTILLWGCEYWLWRAAAGDRRWLDMTPGSSARPEATEPSSALS
jgi:hypothetical protein